MPPARPVARSTTAKNSGSSVAARSATQSAISSGFANGP